MAYFDIFNHPLKKEEIKGLLGVRANDRNLSENFETLLNQQLLFIEREFISLQMSVEKLVNKRTEKEQRARLYLKKLPFYTKLISSFPFVRGVAISGSLSKGVMHKKGDIDYFIVTAKNRLWICRTLLILFKKTFLLNSRKYFCLNYFVDEDNLEIKDKNIFTAIEVTHLIPVFNSSIFETFRIKNNWTEKYFPQFSNPINKKFYKARLESKKPIERLLSPNFGEKLDLFFMRLTVKRWAKKFGNFDAEKFELTMRSNRGISKHHPSDFQSKVLTAYEERLEKLNLTDEGPFFA